MRRSTINQKNQKWREVQCNQSEESIWGEVQSIRRIKRGEKCNTINQKISRGRRGRSAINQNNQ